MIPEQQGNRLLRLAVGIFAVAIALQLAWAVLRPLLPWMAVVVLAVAIFRLVRWWRSDRW